MAFARSLLFGLAPVAMSHPAVRAGRTPPPSNDECESGNVTFFSYHAHVVFEDVEGSPSREAALKLQQDFAAAFGISAEVDPASCNDDETEHGVSPPLCMIDADYGPFDGAHGHWGSPACPFLDAEWAVFVPVARFQEVSSWLTRRRGSVDLLFHPNSGCEVYDHRDWGLWAGAPHDLDLTCLHFDCPGCTYDDCVAHGRRAVLAGRSEQCGLAREGAGVAAASLEVRDAAAFCADSCKQWVREELPRWNAGCPYNCDAFQANETESRECQAHAASLQDMEAWSVDLCDAPMVGSQPFLL